MLGQCAHPYWFLAFCSTCHDGCCSCSMHKLMLSCCLGCCCLAVCTGATIPPAPANSTWPANLCNGTASGGLCQAVCAANFTGTVNTTCVDGVWQAVMGTCKPPASCVSSNLPPPIGNSIWPVGLCNGTSHGGVCTANCSVGYFGPPSTTCVRGAWTNISGVCAPAGG